MSKSFYADIKPNEVEKYQKYFLQMLGAANIENLTKWSQGLEYDSAEYDKSYDNLEPILDQAEKSKLIPTNLQIMFEQYIFADVFEREKYKRRWVQKVLERKDEDFFPDPDAVMKTLDDQG